MMSLEDTRGPVSFAVAQRSLGQGPFCGDQAVTWTRQGSARPSRRTSAKPSKAAVVIDERMVEQPPVATREVLYRMAQEALVNVRNHSHAVNVEVVIEEREHGVQVLVRDDGRGFDPSAGGQPTWSPRSQRHTGTCGDGRRTVHHREHAR